MTSFELTLPVAAHTKQRPRFGRGRAYWRWSHSTKMGFGRVRDYSRVLLLGSRATDTPVAALKERLDQSAVHISIDPALTGAALTLRVLATTLRRAPGRVTIDPRGVPEGLAQSIVEAGGRRVGSRGIQLLVRPPNRAVHVHLGAQAPTRESIRIVPDSHGAHVARDPLAEIHVARPAHPLGAVYAAALGAAEVFKEVAAVRDERRVDHPHLTWCPVALSADLSAAPMQAATLQLDIALAGCGAVGTAIALILNELDAVGTILLVDRERFARENIATYSIGDERNARGRPRKVNLAGDYLRRYHVRPRRERPLHNVLPANARGSFSRGPSFQRDRHSC